MDGSQLSASAVAKAARACETCGVGIPSDPTGQGKYVRFCEACRSARRRRKRLWPATPKIDALIREAWSDPVLYQKAAAQWVSERTLVTSGPKKGQRWPTYIVGQRARTLGLTRKYPKERPWTEREIAILREYHWMSVPRVAKKLLYQCGARRTPSSIINKRKRLMLINTSGYSATGLAGLLGMDSHKLIRFIHRGQIKAERRDSETLGSSSYQPSAKPRDEFHIDDAAARAFILSYPAEIDLCKVTDRIWFIELLGGKGK